MDAPTEEIKWAKQVACTACNNPSLPKMYTREAFNQLMVGFKLHDYWSFFSQSIDDGSIDIITSSSLTGDGEINQISHFFDYFFVAGWSQATPVSRVYLLDDETLITQAVLSFNCDEINSILVTSNGWFFYGGQFYTPDNVGFILKADLFAREIPFIKTTVEAETTADDSASFTVTDWTV